MNGIAGVSFRETSLGLEVRVRKNPGNSSIGKLKKRLPYNFKQLSKQIMQVKTSGAARPLVTKIRAKLSWLYRKLKSGEYGDSEIAAAIIHAASMEKIAKKKVRHLEEEEAAENGSSPANTTGEDKEIYGKDELEESLKENAEFSEEIMKNLMEEIEELEEELAEDMMSEIQDMVSCVGREMSEDEIKSLKRDHRQKEEQQLTRADLKYLKALFDRLEQEKKQASAGSFQAEGNNSSTISFSVDCMPEVELMDVDVGETVDLSG